jgi:hypothetical protein
VTNHERHIQRIGVKYRADRKGFASALRENVDFAEPEDLIEAISLRLLPDLFLFQPGEHLLIIWEVEDTHRLSQKKLAALLKFNFLIYDSAGWDFELRIVDAYGNENTMQAVRESIDRVGLWSSEQVDKAVTAMNRRTERRIQRSPSCSLATLV